MRVEAALVGISALFVIAGQGVLLAAGLTTIRIRTLLASSGLAYLVGVAATLLFGIALLTVGGELNLPVFLVLTLLLGAAGAGIALRRGRLAAAVEPERVAAATRAEKIVIGVALALLLILLVAGLLAAGVRPLAEWDSWSIWTRKAVWLTNNGLDSQLFAAPTYAFSHLDYPILLPLFESVYFRGMGGVDSQAIHAALWIFYVASLGSLAYLGSRFARIWVWLPVVLALALGSQYFGELLTGYADVPMGLMAAPGVLCLGLWMRELDWRYLAAGAPLLAAAASIKNEGLLLMLACFAAAAVVLAVGRAWPLLGRLGLAFAGAVVAILPWQIWVHANDIKSNLPISKGLDPSYLSDHSDRVSPTLKALAPILEGGSLMYVVPIALALVVIGIATRGLRRVAAFYLLAGLGTFASIVWAFVITPDGLDWQIATAGSRVVMGTAFVAAAAIVHLGGLLDRVRDPVRGNGPERAAGQPAADEPTAVLPTTPVPEATRA
jgi:hypothetical protein